MASGRSITIEFLGNSSSVQNAANDAGDSVEGFGSKLRKLGGVAKVGFAAVGAAAVGVGGVVAAGIAEGLEQETLTDKLAAQLGTNEKNSARLGKLAGRLYANAYGDSMADVTAAIASVKSSLGGLTSESGLELATEQAMNYAKIFDIDVTKAANSAGIAIKQGLAKDSSEAFDLITRASQKVGPALAEDVLDASDEYSIFFKGLGFKGPEAFGILVSAAKQGAIGIDKAGDAMKEFQIRATDLGDTGAQEALKNLGIDGGKAANDLLAGGKRAREATDEIVDGLLSIKDPGKQAAQVGALFGTQMEDLGKNKIRGFLKGMQDGEKSLGKFEGAADAAGKTLNDNAAGNLTSFKRQITQTFVNVLGGQVIPWVSKFAKELAVNVGPTLLRVKGWIKNDLLPWLERMRPTFEAIASKVRQALPEIARITRQNFNLVKGIVIDVVSIVQSLWKRFGSTIVQFTVSAFRNVKNVIQGVLKVIGGVVKVFSSLLKGDWKGVWEGIKQILKGAAQILVGIVRQLGNTLRFAFKAAWSAITGIVSGAWSGIKDLARKGFNAVIELVRSVPGRIGKAAKDFAQVGKDLMGSLLSGIGQAGSFAKDFASDLWNAVKGAINDGIDSLNSKLEFSFKVKGVGFTVNAPDIPHLYTGGVVKGSRGGSLVVAGDRGHDEAIVPLSGPNAPNFSAGGGGVTNNFYIQALDPVGAAKHIEKILIVGQRSMSGPYQFKTV